MRIEKIGSIKNPQEIVNNEVSYWIKTMRVGFGDFDEITIDGVLEICNSVEKQLPNVPAPEIEKMVLERIRQVF